MSDHQNQVSAEANELIHRAATRLHHLSMRYGGAIVELAQGRPAGLLPQGMAGLREARDLIDLILLTRAEINGLTKLLLEAGVLKPDAVVRQYAEEYEWFCQEKAKFLGVEVSDAGLVFRRK